MTVNFLIYNDYNKMEKNFVMMLLTSELLILLVINANAISGIVNSSCNFDNGTCGWLATGRDQYKWTHHHGHTSYASTGPDKDHTTASENGYYFYTKSQIPSKLEAVSDLYSDWIRPSSKQCLTFWYHMYGSHINTLKVFQKSSNHSNKLWNISADQGNKWHFQSLYLNDIGPYRIIFRATRGKGFTSEIAVDDIIINNSECKKVDNTCKTSDVSDTIDTNDTSDGSDTSDTGIVVGLIIGGILLACVVIVIVVFIRRHTSKSRPREKIRNNLRENDYIGTQDIALPLPSNDSSHIQNDGKNTNTAYAVHRNITVSDNSTLSDHKYSIVDQTPETTLNETIKDGKGTTDSYMILDPTATGFNRTTLPNTRSDYEFAKPVMDAENNFGDQDQYALSEEGVYDHSGNNRHKESDVNIYNHAVDTIYDSGSHKRNDEGRDDTYDHFFGQKTEDDYDISTTT